MRYLLTKKNFFVLSLLIELGFGALHAEEFRGERELIQDNHFQRGFILWKPEPGKHVPSGEIKSFETNSKPAWGLSQWSSKFPLTNFISATSLEGVLIYSNSAKIITFGTAKSAKADLSMAINTGAEYGARTRLLGEPWVHLLVEQEFESRPALTQISQATLHVETRLLRSKQLDAKGYTPEVHSAQFTIFFTVQNLNRSSAGFGDAVWFGIPIYDNRHRFPPEFKERDFGGTARFIFTPEGKMFTFKSAHDGEWIIIEKDLLPLMREALETAWKRGFLKESKNFADYFIGGMNMGWELPGTFDVEMQVRNLSLKIQSCPVK